jgi:hypothetical protein
VGRHPRTAQSRDKVASGRRQGDHAPSGGGVRGAVLFLAGAVVATLVASLIAGADKKQPRPIVPVTAAVKQDTAPDADLSARLGDLLTLTDADLATADVARLNLDAAEGLPGAEGLDVDAKLAELDRWAKHVASETERNLHRFRENPAEYENSEAYFRALMLIVALQGDLGVHYNPERISEPDFTNSKDLFLHGMIGDSNGGTCSSMPVLYVAIGRRLGYPMRLAVAKAHVFARWDGGDHPNPAFRGRFNVEGTNRGLNTFEDEYYAEHPMKLTERERQGEWYLRSLTPSEELAIFLMQRGHCLEDTGRLAEAQVAYAIAHRLAPKSPEGLDYLVNVVRREAMVRASADPEALAARANRDSTAKWMAQKRREGEEVAREAVERGRFKPAMNPSSPAPPLRGAPTPRVPGLQN